MDLEVPGPELYEIWGKHKLVTGALQICFDFRQVAPLGNQNISKEKIRPNFALYCPRVKYEEWAECLCQYLW